MASFNDFSLTDRQYRSYAKSGTGTALKVVVEGTTGDLTVNGDLTVTEDTILVTATTSGVITGTAGAVGAPMYSFSSDTDTGIYLVSDGRVGIATAGAKRVDITSGTFTVSDRFETGFDGSAADISIGFRDANTGFWNSGPDTGIGMGVLNTEVFMATTTLFDIFENRYEFNAVGGFSLKADDAFLALGASGDAGFIYETADANANALYFIGTPNDGTNVPAFVFGDTTLLNKDLGFFDGISYPVISVVGSSASDATYFGHDGSNGVYAIVGDGGHRFYGMIKGDKGSDKSSANNMTAPTANFFDVTGTTQINTMASTNIIAGTYITMQFDDSVTVKHATAGTGAQFFLAGSADFSATAGDVLHVLYDGTYYKEISRTVF